MARIGLGSCLGILAFLTAPPVPAAEPAVPPSQAIAATLAVQEAMRQGRELLHNGRAEEAVEVLEAQLTRVNGNPAYLALLRGLQQEKTAPVEKLEEVTAQTAPL